ncbi:monocarboxylate transporter 9-like [Liolophura sinensis]|uniref:monocarboxylate transporter 9-like n=1 Tax=Liolophura sinensis TaxID=3198878 RepID=UPI003158A767
MSRTTDNNSVEQPWGWLVTAAAFTVHILSLGFSWSTGVLNAIFLDTFDDPALDISWVGTLLFANMLSSGVVAAVFINKYGCRVTTIVGGILASSGLVLSFFSPNIYFLYFSLGVVSGIGGGFSFLASVTMVTHYFDKRRSIALGITSSGVGFGQFLFPALIRWLYQSYDWSGVLLILGGVLLNTCAFGAIFRPMELPKTIGMNDDAKEEERQQQGLHCAVFQNPGYVCMCLNNILVCMGLATIYIHLPAYGESLGIDGNKSAMLMSAVGLANLLARSLIGVVDHYLTNRTFHIYAITFVLTGISVMLMPVTSNYLMQMVFAVMFGLFSGGFGALLSLILAQIVGLRHFATAYGYILLFEALGTLSGGPLAGFLYDITQMYDASLYVSGSCLILSATLVIVPYRQSCRATDGLQIQVMEEIMPMNRYKPEVS